MKAWLARTKRFVVWACVSGVLVSSVVRLADALDPGVATIKQAIVKDEKVRMSFGNVNEGGINLLESVDTVDRSRALRRSEYTVAVSGSDHAGRLKVLVLTSTSDGKMQGRPEVVGLTIRN